MIDWKWLVFAWGLVLGGTGSVAAREASVMRFSSTAFASGAEIPAKHTCQGSNVSPPFDIGELPPGTKSLAIVVDDPDAPDPAAPKTTWVHWVMYNLAPQTTVLAEGVALHSLPGAMEGSNDWKVTGYRGPCPPIGKHRYYFKLYALDALLPDLHKPTKAALEKAMAGHVLGHAEWMGVYKKK